MHAFSQICGQAIFDCFADLPFVIARAEVDQHDQLILKPFGTLDEIIDVHVAEFVNFLSAVFGPEECHLGNEHAGIENLFTVINARWCGVPRVANQWVFDNFADFVPSKADVSDLVPGKSLIFGFQFFPAVPDNKAH